MKNQVKRKRTPLLVLLVLVAFIIGLGIGLLIPNSGPLHISKPVRTGTGKATPIGISYGNTLPWESSSVLSQTLDDAMALGITTIRLDFGWDDIQPVSASTYNW